MVTISLSLVAAHVTSFYEEEVELQRSGNKHGVFR